MSHGFVFLKFAILVLYHPSNLVAFAFFSRTSRIKIYTFYDPSSCTLTKSLSTKQNVCSRRILRQDDDADLDEPTGGARGQ